MSAQLHGIRPNVLISPSVLRLLVPLFRNVPTIFDASDPFNLFNFDVFEALTVASENPATYDLTSLVWALHLWRVCQRKARADLNGCELTM